MSLSKVFFKDNLEKTHFFLENWKWAHFIVKMKTFLYNDYANLPCDPWMDMIPVPLFLRAFHGLLMAKTLPAPIGREELNE